MKPVNEWPLSTKPYRSNPPEGSAGLVLPIRDNLKFFKLAFHSILDFTDYRFMLTLVDNMSGFSTRQYLESIRRNHAVNVLQYQQVHSQGAEWNLALRFMFAFSNVHYGVVLTPDVVVEPNWLSRLVRSLNDSDGPISPRANAAGPLLPFCAAFKRPLYERLGGFDEQLHDAGLCMANFGERSNKARFRPLQTDLVYVHHFERSGWRTDADLLTQDETLLNQKQDKVPA